MGKAAREQLNRVLSEHLNTIHETFQMLDQTPASSLEKVSWKEVIQIGEQVSKQATMVGMLYTGETPGVKALEESMATYFNILQGLVLLSHGSSVGAGPTLASCIHGSVKQVVDTSFLLLQGAVSSYGSSNKTQKLSIPQLVGAVWDACSALKKTPATNVTAIGRAMTQVTVSIKDVLREMKELKPSSDDPTDEDPAEVSTKDEDKSNSDGDSCDGDMGNDLSPEEMKIAQLATSIVSETLVVVKELIRSITALLKRESSGGDAISVDSLEKLLKLCQGTGVQIDELGACLYPPQEISAIKVALEKISSFTNETETELRNLKGLSEDFSKACTSLRGWLRQLETELGCSTVGDLVPEFENLVVSN
ncbi:cyclin-D1-binding protein [Perilla frutescens var. frutescens]|nr:cyclin-D1-binding protein [Perilla frutescens var. frutescens]